MKKITILALHLGYGGIERAITDLANNLTPFYDVTIVSTYKLYSEPVNTLKKEVKVKYLTDLKPNRENFKDALKKLKIITVLKEGIQSLKILYLRKKLMVKYIKECDSDVIISTRELHNSWLGKYGKDESIKIGWEHNHHHGNMKYAKKVVNSSKKLDYLVLVSKDLTNFYKDRTKTKCVYIPNMIEQTSVKSNLKEKNLISIGRLSPEKGFLDLIDVFEIINKTKPDWKLNIIGDGIQKECIIQKIKDKNLEEYINMHGYLTKEEMKPILEKSSIYLMTSFTESFGIVLLESFSFGIPCVAFDSAEGAKEIIENNKNGYLIKDRDKQEMANAVLNLIEDYDKRIEFGQKGLEKSYEFDKVKVKKMWDKIIK